jgi:uncharacterized membrane protein YphA (DoxX/SURF4 family)
MGLVWSLNLLFIVNPQNAYFSTFSATAQSFASTSLGGPGFAAFVAQNGTVFAWAIAVLTAYLAVAFLLGFSTRIACVVGAVASVFFLVTQVGSTFFFPGGTDVGPHPLYLLVYAVLLIGGAGGTLSVDRWLRERPASKAGERRRDEANPSA